MNEIHSQPTLDPQTSVPVPAGPVDAPAAAAEIASKQRPGQPDSRIDAAVPIFQHMEEDYERQFRRPSPYNLR
jgi:hypothetical protein